ncbi:MAG: hypothetical protein AAF288_11840 [Planctomycetota bacterium]
MAESDVSANPSASPSAPPRVKPGASASPYATTALVLVSAVSLFWCVETMIDLAFRWRLELTGTVRRLGPLTLPEEHVLLLIRGAAQAGLVAACLGLWWLADKRRERWGEARDFAAGWGATPGLALPAAVLLTLVVRQWLGDLMPAWSV